MKHITRGLAIAILLLGGCGQPTAKDLSQELELAKTKLELAKLQAAHSSTTATRPDGDKVAERIVDQKIWPLMTKRSDVGLPPTKNEVKGEFGFAPSETKKIDMYEIERYNFKASTWFVEVAYVDGRLHKIVVNKEFAPSAGDDLMRQIKTIEDGENDE